jgi:zinc D-Ala-D-Ala dipeptidase
MSEYETTNSRLESEMLTYMDLADVLVRDTGESMVELVASPSLLVSPHDPEMKQVTGDKIFVRESVRYMLGSVCLNLAQQDKSLQLQVLYGYRSLAIQRRNHERVKRSLEDKFSGIDLTEAAHRYVAEPSVAGHPTGGAVDVQLARGGVPLSFGTQVREFVPESYAKSPFVDRVAQANRQLLRKTMLNIGFAPFDGEWWHFSYGDREWAKFYKKPSAIYEQLEFKGI